MCVTNIFVDRFPDGKEISFHQTSFCQYGQPGRPCQSLSTLENPVRKIQFGEPTTQYMMTAHQRTFPLSPPHSSGGSHHRHSGDYSDDGRLHRRRSRRRSEIPALRPTRTHRKERIVIVDSPPTPRTPPQTFRTFTAPSSPATTPFIIDGALPLPLPRERDRERGRPIIVDERPLLRHPRVPSIGAIVGSRTSPIPIPRRQRARSQSRNRAAGTCQWESPSTSHTSFDSRARREAEELERRFAAERERERDQRIAALEAERRREQRIREQDEEIRRRPAIPIPPQPLRERQSLRPVVTVDQSEALRGMLGNLNLDGRGLVGERALISESERRRRLEDRDRFRRARLAEREEEELKARLRERQMPRRRFSVGPGNRRHRVLYDDGVYRWE